MVDASVLTFDWTSALLKMPRLVVPILTYIWPALEASFHGEPTLFLCDEMNILTQHPKIAACIDRGLRLWRYQNVAFTAATQSVEDILTDATLRGMVVQSCLTRWLPPNPAAWSRTCRPAYESLDLTEREIQTIREAPRHSYYYQRQGGSNQYEGRLFRIDLDGAALAVCGRTSIEDQTRMTQLLEEYGPDGFWVAWLRDSGVPVSATMARHGPHDGVAQLVTHGR
jgi:type IV secretion system protein VirB4